MQSDAVEPFPDNWTYLRAELNWLDRILGMAVAQQRKEAKELEHLVRSRADRATSHWWKGLLTLDGEIAYDSPAEMPRRRSGKGNYQQQMNSKIRASEQQGICLGVPSLQKRLQLSGFEKNLVLLALAPEISRRYGRIYNYLQDTEQPGSTGLPSVDLLLRLLCRNDAEWRLGRQCLASDSMLVKTGLLEVHASRTEPFLGHLVKLADPLVNYLLASHPQSAQLETLFTPSFLPTPSPLPPPTAWTDLVLPDALLQDLQHLCHRVQFLNRVDREWGFQNTVSPGVLALLVGKVGTGKTTAAQAIAHSLQAPLWVIDLALIHPSQFPKFLQEVKVQVPSVLLLKSAEVWLRSTSTLSTSELHGFFENRRQQEGMTLFSTTRKQSVSFLWRQQLQVLEFPLPDLSARLRLWKQSLPAEVPLSGDLDWQALAHQFPLTGGEIRTIVREAAIYAAAESSDAKLEFRHLMQACTQRVQKSRRR